MQRAQFWLLAVVVGLVLWVAPESQANPLRAPRRLVNGQTVNLAPLFHWWTNHSGARPLTAWVHVTGRVVGTNSFGWIIEARSKGAGASSQSQSAAASGRLLLRHPPLEDRAEFERLSARLKALNQERTTAENEKNAAHNRVAEVSKEENNYRKRGLRNRNLKREESVLRTSENQAKAELKPLDEQIKNLKKQLAAYPSPDQYELDCFALDTGQNDEHLPIFEHGAALQ